MIWIITIGLFVLIIIWLLFAPIRLVINNVKDDYGVYYGKSFSLSLIPRGLITNWKLKLKILFFEYYIRFDQISNKKKKCKNKKEVRKIRMCGSFNQMKSLFHSFKISKFSVDLDTGDCIWNAYLFPILFLLNQKKGIDVKVNYQNNNIVDIEFKNRGIRIIHALISKSKQ